MLSCRVVVVAVEVGGSTQFQHGTKGGVDLCGGYTGAGWQPLPSSARLVITCLHYISSAAVRWFYFDSCHSGSFRYVGGTPA